MPRPCRRSSASINRPRRIPSPSRVATSRPSRQRRLLKCACGTRLESPVCLQSACGKPNPAKSKAACAPLRAKKSALVERRLGASWGGAACLKMVVSGNLPDPDRPKRGMEPNQSRRALRATSPDLPAPVAKGAQSTAGATFAALVPNVAWARCWLRRPECDAADASAN